jgi:hypothetical protein
MRTLLEVRTEIAALTSSIVEKGGQLLSLAH